jgi:hypothetical protein
MGETKIRVSKFSLSAMTTVISFEGAYLYISIVSLIYEINAEVAELTGSMLPIQKRAVGCDHEPVSSISDPHSFSP